MVSRSLTDVFILMRNNSIQNRSLYIDQGSSDQPTSDRVALICRTPLVVEEDIELGGSEGSLPPPVWIDDLLDIKYNCSLISQKMKELDVFQGKHVQRPTFDDDVSNEMQIEEITQTITRLFGTCHRIVQQMQHKGHKSSWSERKLRDNVIKDIVNTLQDLSHKFRSSQGGYLRKITAREEMSNQYFNIPNIPDDTSSAYNYDEVFLETEGLGGGNWSQAQLLALEENNVSLQEREREVQQILKSIFDLNSIFRELATMIENQAGFVENIEQNVESTHVKVEEGTKHLRKAADYQKRNRKCVFLVSIVLITVLLIILLVAFGT